MTAPTFGYEGNIASFYPRLKRAGTLLFHTGAARPDPDGLLDGEADTSRVTRFVDTDDLAAKRAAPQRLACGCRSRVDWSTDGITVATTSSSTAR